MVSHCEGTAVLAVCGAVFEPASCDLIRTAVHGAVVECVSVVPEVCSTLHGGLRRVVACQPVATNVTGVTCSSCKALSALLKAMGLCLEWDRLHADLRP
jgi:hypothetical protein